MKYDTENHDPIRMNFGDFFIPRHHYDITFPYNMD